MSHDIRKYQYEENHILRPQYLRDYSQDSPIGFYTTELCNTLRRTVVSGGMAKMPQDSTYYVNLTRTFC